MKVIFRPVIINNYKTRYIVSNTGIVKSLNYHNTKIEKEMKLKPDKDGYLTVNLSIMGHKYNMRVHRLVAMIFIPIPNHLKKLGYTFNTLEVNHENGVKNDNNVNNLSWVTSKENIRHAERTGLRTHKHCEDHPMSTIDNNKVIEICKLLEENKLSITEISKKLDVSFTVVYNILYKNAWKEITKYYNIKNYDVKSDRSINCTFKKYSDEMIHNVCIYLEKGDKTMKEIEELTGVNVGQIQSIKYRQSRTNISKNYNFNIRQGKYNKHK